MFENLPLLNVGNNDNHAGLTENRARVNASNYRMRQREIEMLINEQWQTMEWENVDLREKIALRNNIKDKLNIYIIKQGLQSEVDHFRNNSK
jgi:hypothetical protein